MTAPGWYNAQGDPPGTTRYWDGERWVGDPVYTPVTSPTGGGGYVDTRGGGGVGLQLASPGSRIGARFIDGIIATVIALIVLVPFIMGIVDDIDALGANPTDAEVERVLRDAFENDLGNFAIFGVIAVLWDVIWVGIFGGTPGKLILGLRVARADTGANPPGWGKAALRALNRLVSLIPGFGSLISLLVGLASLIMLFADSQHRTVMDRVAGTVVIKK